MQYRYGREYVFVNLSPCKVDAFSDLQCCTMSTLQKACTRCCSRRSCSGLAPPSAPLLLPLGSLVLPFPFLPIPQGHLELQQLPSGSHRKWQAASTIKDPLSTTKRLAKPGAAPFHNTSNARSSSQWIAESFTAASNEHSLCQPSSLGVGLPTLKTRSSFWGAQT